MEQKSELKPQIIIREDASYLVKGGVKLTVKMTKENESGERIDWIDGDDFPEKTAYSLCRCGHSKNKPYCDSSHKEKLFDGRLTADRSLRSSREVIYEGKDITMSDDESLCAGFAYCDRFGSVWVEIENSGDKEVKQRIEKQISMCPSGRLLYYLENRKEPSEVMYEPMIAVIPDGPLWVLGNVCVETQDGFVYEIRNRQLLCRCGHSGNKPFCDGTHSRIGFKG